MLAVRPLKSSGDEIEFGGDQFLDFSDENLLDCIDFEELFSGMADEDGDGDILPELEMFDPTTEFAVSGSSGGEESDANVTSLEKSDDVDSKEFSSETDSTEVKVVSSEESDSAGRKSSEQTKKRLKKNHHGKRKLKVDWTTELHRKFVQAVEQLGLDKAVPSKILEIMAVDGLTRHNIASHLQKYRSQRKHVLAREAAEAASWSQRRQMYGTAVAGKRVLAGPWLSGPPTMGFPPAAPPPPPPPIHSQFSRPLHVWGHPSMDRQWPKHMSHSPPLWPVPPPYLPPSDNIPYWQPQPHHHQVNRPVTHGTPCYPPLPAMPGLSRSPSTVVYNDGSSPQLRPFDFHPSKESVDAAIGDALTKPWQPLPLGLRAPSVDSVLSELHRQGIPKVPPT